MAVVTSSRTESHSAVAPSPAPARPSGRKTPQPSWHAQGNLQLQRLHRNGGDRVSLQAEGRWAQSAADRPVQQAIAGARFGNERSGPRDGSNLERARSLAPGFAAMASTEEPVQAMCDACEVEEAEQDEQAGPTGEPVQAMGDPEETEAADTAEATEAPETAEATEAPEAAEADDEPVQARSAACATEAAAPRQEEPVQEDGSGPSPGRNPALIHQEARRGLSNASQPLPHADRLQAAFGHHDISQVRAAVGGAAETANRRMGALAFASGDRVAFRQTPDLRLVAHEAAHVVQQREGLALPGNVGQRGDRWERHADDVADAVAAGRSAEPLLDQVAPPTVHVDRMLREASQDQKHTATDQRLVVPRTYTGATSMPEGGVQMAPADGTKDLLAWMQFRGEVLVLKIHPNSDTIARFDADPSLLDKLGTALTNALNPAGLPVPETWGFLTGSVVRRLVEDDLPRWVDVPDSSLVGLEKILKDRATEFSKQAVRSDIEAYLGVNPGTVNWPALLPGIREAFYAKGNQSLRNQSLRDRAEFVLLVLETEVASVPSVFGGVVPPRLSDSVWDFAMTYNLAKNTSPKAFSEKYLFEYVKMIAALEFVPTDFDLARYKPSGADLAADRRHQILDEWIDANATEATTRFVLDDWTISGLDFKSYLLKLDLDALKSSILDKLTDAFLLAAKGDWELNRALIRMADAQATYAILARIVAAGHSAEKRNRDLIEAIDDPDPNKHPELDDLAGDPRTIYEGEFYLAEAIKNVLLHVQVGARVDIEVVTNAVAITGKANIPPSFSFGVFLFTLLTELGTLAEAKETERKHAREDIAERVDVHWDTIKKIIDNRGKEAEKFLDGSWIPMLKMVATEWVDSNYKELKDAYDNFATWASQSSGRYKLGAWLIEDTANKIESGEMKSSTLNGATVTKDDVKELRTAVTVLRAKAAELDSPKGRDEKRDELKKAMDAYATVKTNIADGTYKPENYGDDVVVEAKKRLRIGMFEYTNLWHQATRQVVVRDNPFQAYVIAMWRVENIIEKAASNILAGLLRGALTVGSLIVPGVGGLILAGIDIGIGVFGAGKNVFEARRRLDLARLDTQLKIQGISVADADHALNMAWVSFAIELALAGLFSALLGKMAFKGIESWRLPTLTKLAETDAALAAKLVERIGDAKLTETLLGHFAADGNRLSEALAYVKDGKSLVTLLGKVKNSELLSSLLISTGSETKLFELLDKFKNVNKLDTLLGVATRQQLLRLIAFTKDEAMVAKLVEGMGPSRAISLMESGLTAEHAIALDRLGENAVMAFKGIAATGDAEATAGAVELLRLNQKGALSSEAAASALTKTAAFGEKYAGRVSGDFASRFARVADQELKVAKIQGKIADLKAAGKSTANAEKQLAGAEAAYARAKAETNAATDILEGRSVFGKDRSVRAIPESEVEGVETPEFVVTGGGKADAIAEVKAIGDDTGKIGKDVLQRNFRKAASQISGQAAAKGQTGGLVRLDAGKGTLPKTNAEIAAEVKGQWMESIKKNPARANDVGWVEILDTGPAGESQRLLLKVDGSNLTIDAAGTTRP